MNENHIKFIPKYFAAANTYLGFKSYFDIVFSPADFDRIYVLKGGPGTGKSSFMKKASLQMRRGGCEVEEIYCSSDPASLDGVIAANSSKKIAILDGTAPHERDAVIPGAIDEIVNLGYGWDTRWLSARKDEIFHLAQEKSSAYKTAYNYLSFGGYTHDFINSIYKSYFDKTKAKNTAEAFLNSISCTGGKIKTRLISSFGKKGEARLDTLSHIDGNRLSVHGNDISTSILLSLCKDILENNNVNFTHFISALDPSETDALFIPDCNLIIERNSDGEINADEFISLPAVAAERIKKAKELWRESLDEAQRWFAIASDLHFRLEKIYGEAMNFSIIDEIFDSKLAEICNILEINT